MEKVILFVDDEVAILNAIKRVFRKSAHTVLFASSGEEALNIIQSTPVSVLVSDYSMPDTTGADLLAKAKVIRPGMVRIILSGNNDQEATINSINQGGASRFLTKPWEDRFLLDEIEKALTEWESDQYICSTKKILNQSGILDLIDAGLSAEDSEEVIVASIGIKDFEKLKDNIGVSDIALFLTDLAPAVDALGQGNSLAIMNDQNFCMTIQCASESNNSKQLITDLLDSFSNEYMVRDQKVSISYDVGYVLTNRSTQSSSELIGNANTALKLAKSLDSDEIVMFDKGMDERKNKHFILEINLNEALEKQEFFLNYQPKINLSDGSLHGAEALIRWNSSELGVVPPFDFIPLAEQSRLIYDIGEWVMRDAFTQWADWFSKLPASPVISINVSPKQLNERSFINRVEKCISTVNISPEYLELEITENLAVDNLDSTIAVLKEIKQLGLKISIDDFGTGYSSLSYLNKLPADIIKIDRSFIMPMLESSENSELVNNLIRLGHDMGMQIVAEGVEDEQQLNVLREFGCDVIQGYYFSPPVSAEDFLKFWRKLDSNPNIFNSGGISGIAVSQK